MPCTHSLPVRPIPVDRELITTPGRMSFSSTVSWPMSSAPYNLNHAIFSTTPTSMHDSRSITPLAHLRNLYQYPTPHSHLRSLSQSTSGASPSIFALIRQRDCAAFNSNFLEETTHLALHCTRSILYSFNSTKTTLESPTTAPDQGQHQRRL